MDALLKVVKAFVEGAVDELFEQIDHAKDEWSKATDEVPEPPKPPVTAQFSDKDPEAAARLIRREFPATAAEVVRLAKMDADDDVPAGSAGDSLVSRLKAAQERARPPVQEPVIYEAFEEQPNVGAEQPSLTFAQIADAIPQATTAELVEDLLKWTLALDDLVQRKRAGVALLQQVSRMLYSPDFEFSDEDKTRLVITKVDIGMQIFGLNALLDEGNRTKGPDTPTTDF